MEAQTERKGVSFGAVDATINLFLHANYKKATKDMKNVIQNTFVNEAPQHSAKIKRRGQSGGYRQDINSGA